MQSMKVQTALQEFGQVDVLIEMIIGHLLSDPDYIRDRGWYEKLQNALHLLEATYRAKHDGLVLALEGGGHGA